MRDHNYTPRAERLVIMDDREIQETSRCYRCGGHHPGRVTCSSWGGSRGVFLVIGLLTVAAALSACGLF